MDSIRVRSLLALMVALLLQGVLSAQTTGRIGGRITGVGAEPLPGVTVTASSSRLQGSRSAQSDAEGRFLFSALPPGIYTVVATLDGFNPLEIPNLKVSLDRTATLEMELTEAFGDAITVVGEAPIVDVTRPAVGDNLSETILGKLPTSRTFEGLAILAPGVTFTSDPPFTDKSNVSIRGASVAENRYLVDGLDITDPINGMLRTSLAFDFVEEVEVKTGGWEIDYDGALGGVVNVVTRSGGNEFRGDLFGYFTDDSLQASSSESLEYGRQLGFSEYDWGFDLGGKLIRDELWYFVALNPTTRTDDLENRQGIAFDPTRDGLFWAGKLNWQPGPAHRLVGSAFGESADSQLIGLNAAGRLVDEFEFDTQSIALSYSATLSPQVLFEVLAGRHDREDQTLPSSEVSPGYTDLTGTGIWAQRENCGDPEPLAGGGAVNFAAGCIGGGGVSSGEAVRDQLRATSSWLVGRHELRGGLEYRDQSMRGRGRLPAPFPEPLIDNFGVVVDPDGVAGGSFLFLPDGLSILMVRDGSTPAASEEIGIFAQDRWLVRPNLTLNLGLRLNTLEATGVTSDTLPNRRIDFGFDDMIAPRASLLWDPTAQGRSRLFGSFARYFESNAMFSHAVAFGDNSLELHFFVPPFDGSLPGYRNLGLHLFSTTVFDEIPVDPALEPTYVDEFIVGYDYQLGSHLALGIKAVYRNTENIFEDISLDIGNGQRMFILTNPGGNYQSNPLTGEALAEPEIYPEAVREYRALELTMERRLRDNWQLFSSYVYSESEGNYDGMWIQHFGGASHITAGFDTSGSLLGASGPLPNDRPHQFKVYGSYRFPFDLVAGFNGAYLSGTPISKLGIEAAFLVPMRFVEPRGSAGRTPDVWFIDLHLQQPFTLRSRLTLSLIADLFNVTNEQSPTRVDELWTSAALLRTLDPSECGGPGSGPGTDCPLGNPLWGTPLEFQPPRALRLGAKLSW